MLFVFGCGFFCDQPSNSFLFAIFSLYYYKRHWYEIYWSNSSMVCQPKNPVGVNATLKLTLERGLVLQDTDGTIAWLTNISSKSVPSLNLTWATSCCWMKIMQQCGSLLITELKLWLLCKSWWQGKISLWSGELFLLSLTHEGLSAYINYNAPQCYFSYNTSYCKTGYVQFQYQSISIKASLEPKGWNTHYFPVREN